MLHIKIYFPIQHILIKLNYKQKIDCISVSMITAF